MILELYLQRKKSNSIIKLLGITFKVTFFLPFAFLLIKEFFYDFSSILTRVILISNFSICLISALTLTLLHEFENIGKIMLSHDMISIISDFDKTIFYINKIENLKVILQGGYEGETRIYSITDSTGNGNVLEICKNGKTYKYYFKLCGEYQYKKIINIINEWQSIYDNVFFD